MMRFGPGCPLQFDSGASGDSDIRAACGRNFMADDIWRSVVVDKAIVQRIGGPGWDYWDRVSPLKVGIVP